MVTQLINKYIKELARYLRNLPDYDDFEYGTEVIPGDKTWCKKRKSSPGNEISSKEG